MPDARISLEAESDISEIIDSFLKLDSAANKVQSSVSKIGDSVNELNTSAIKLKKNLDITETFEIDDVIEQVDELIEDVKELPKVYSKYVLPDMSMPFYDEGWTPDDIKIDWIEGVFDDLEDTILTEMEDFSKGVKNNLITDVEHWFTPETPGKEVTGTSMGFSTTDTKLMRADEKARSSDDVKKANKASKSARGIAALAGALGKPLDMIKAFIQNVVKNSVVLQNIYNLVLLPITTLLNFVFLPVLKWMVPLITSLVKTIVDNKESLETAGNVIAGILKAITVGASLYFDSLIGLFNLLITLSELTWNAIGDFVQDVIDAFDDFFSDIWDGIVGFFTGELSAEELLEKIATAFTDLISDIIDAIWNGIVKVSEIASTLATVIWTKLSEIFTGIFDWFSDVWGALTSEDPLGELGKMLDNWLNPSDNGTTNNNSTTYNYYWDASTFSFRDDSGQIIDVNSISLKGGL